MVDLNTIDNYKGTIMQSQLSHPSVSKAEKNIQLLKGFNQVSFGFSRAIRKEKLTQPEDALDTLLDVIGGDIIDNRIGMMLLDKDQIGNAKIVLLDVNADMKKTKISVDNNDKLNARYIFEQFHKTKSFAPGKESAQRYIYSVPKVEMNLNDVLTVMDEGNVRFKNKIMEVVSCSWNSGSRLADFVVNERKNYTTNLVETLTEPDGN